MGLKVQICVALHKLTVLHGVNWGTQRLSFFAAQNIVAQIRQEHFLHINAAYDAPLVNISNNNTKLKLSIHPSCAHSASELPKEIHPFVYVSSRDTVFLFE